MAHLPGPQAIPSWRWDKSADFSPPVGVHRAGTQTGEWVRDESLVWTVVTDVIRCHPDFWPSSGGPFYSSVPPKSSSHGQGGQQAGPHHVVDEVGEGPDDRDAHEGDAEQHDVEKADGQHVGEPDAAAVHHPCVRVHLAVCRAHVHPAAPSCRCSANKQHR
ncbi:hypothetical protein D623_10030377 [Myotis brandtii]|uniref:Uncharacterized protein n=1 Tax=Myotis brandtii TaxID=109478 RepID=S7MNG8_MYOBR|nr:hypothetical protein D623_10030377 [Myotis brandtii]